MQTNITASDPSTPGFPQSDLPAGKITSGGKGQAAFPLPSDPGGQFGAADVEREVAITEELALADLEGEIEGLGFDATFKQVLALDDVDPSAQANFGVTDDSQVDTELEQPAASDVAFQMVFTQISKGNSEPRAAEVDLDMLPALLASPETVALTELQTLAEINAASDLTAAGDGSSMFTTDDSSEGFSLLDQGFTEAGEFEIDLAPAIPEESVPQSSSHAINQRDEIAAGPLASVSPKEVTQVVSDKLVQQVQLTESGEQKQLTLQLHPAELGQVTLQVDWENESLKVKIVANEMVATEILNQNKSELVSALAEQGIDFDSLDVAYESAQPEQQEDQEGGGGRSLAPDLFSDPAEGEAPTEVSASDSSSLDIKV